MSYFYASMEVVTLLILVLLYIRIGAVITSIESVQRQIKGPLEQLPYISVDTHDTARATSQMVSGMMQSKF